MKWIKTNGNEIETNDEPATIEYCESLGWKEAGKSKAKKETEAKTVEVKPE